MVDTARKLALALIPVLGVLWLLDLPREFGVGIVGAQFLCVMAGLSVAAAFLAAPYRGEAAGWLEAVLALTAFSCWAWSAWNYNDWLLSMATRGPEKWLPGLLGLVLLAEAVRRSCGNAIAGLLLAVALYGLFGHWLPGSLQAAYTPPTRLIVYLYADSNGVPGIVLDVAATTVLAFIVFGAVLEFTGGARFFTDMALAAMGRRRGGPAKVAVAASSVFGTLNGSTVGNVMGTGIVTIPLMRRSGMPGSMAAGIEAVASNGGQLMPPVMGATAFLIAEFLQIDYAEVVAAALLPALLYFLALFVQIDVFAKRQGLKGLPADQLPRFGRTLAGGWMFLAPLALLVYLLFWGGYEAGRAALLATGGALVVWIVARRELPRPSVLFDMAAKAGRDLLPVLLVSAGAGIVIGVINISGLGFSLTLMLTQVAQSGGVLLLLLLTAAIAVVLGMGMPTAAVYVVLSVVLGPALIKAGIAPLAAHLFIFYYGLLSMLTPPVALASYAAASLAGSDMWTTGWTGLKLAASAYLLPFLFCLNPALLMQGSFAEVAISLSSATAAAYLLGLGMTEFLVPTGRKPLRGLALLATAVAVGASSIVFGPASPAVLAIAAAVLLVPVLRNPLVKTQLHSNKGSLP